MLYKRGPAVFVLSVVLTICGCKGATSPPEDGASTKHQTPSGPSIIELEDEAKLLGELIDEKACVFAFSGTFLEVWLEHEVKEGDMEGKFFSSPPMAITRRMSDQMNGTIPVPDGKVVVWGDILENPQMRMTVKHAKGSEGARENFPFSLAPLPKELGEGWIGGLTSSSVGFNWECPSQLPGEGQEFTIATHRSTNKAHRKTTKIETKVLRTVTVRIKGRCLPLIAPSPASAEQEAVVALRKVGAWVLLEGFVGQYEGNSQRTAKRVSFARSLDIEESQRVADADLVWLKQLAELERLKLAGTEVTDDGLEHLGEMVQLKTLDLRNTKITDTGLMHLEGLTSLQKIFLRETKVTDAGVADLQKSLPNCKISK